MSFIYPWQQTEWQRLWQARLAKRLPHAILLAGVAGIGKAHFADCFSRALLCQAVTENGQYCGDCHACRLIATRAHPSVLWVQPEKENSAIKVDQIRTINEFTNQTALQGDYRLVIIHPADQMNVNAANALLKTLEEPPKGALLLLVSDEPARLPATIRSRCQQITFKLPATLDALAWLESQKLKANDLPILLQLAQGAPLTALRYATDDVLSIRQSVFDTMVALSQKQAEPLKAASALAGEEALPIIDFMLSWIIDLIRVQVGGGTVFNQDYQSQIINLCKQTKLQENKAYMDNLLAQRKLLCHGLNLNKQLMFESLFIRWRESAACF